MTTACSREARHAPLPSFHNSIEERCTTLAVLLKYVRLVLGEQDGGRMLAVVMVGITEAAITRRRMSKAGEIPGGTTLIGNPHLGLGYASNNLAGSTATPTTTTRFTGVVNGTCRKPSWLEKMLGWDN